MPSSKPRGAIPGIRQLRNDYHDECGLFAFLKFHTLLNSVYFFVKYEMLYNKMNWNMITYVLATSLPNLSKIYETVTEIYAFMHMHSYKCL